MKSLSFANRLARDFEAESFIDLSADVRLHILDAINGGLQKLNAHSPHESRTTTAAIFLAAPQNVSIGVTKGIAAVTGHTFAVEDLYRTIRVAGDAVDNQIVSETELLHPYTGATGTFSAIIYADAVTVPEPYDEMVGDPVILETGRAITHFTPPPQYQWANRNRSVAAPNWYHFEPNARNQNPPAPSVIRFDTLPDRAYRMQAKFTLAPARVLFSELLSPDATIPLRQEQVEVYLLPICRGLLTSSRKWKDPETKAAARADAEAAEVRYEALIPRTLGTPRNFVRTKEGF